MNRPPTPGISRKEFLRAFSDPTFFKGTRRKSIHPDVICQQIAVQRNRARSICLAALSEIPEEENSEEVSQETLRKENNHSPVGNGDIVELRAHPPQSSAINIEQIKRAYRRTSSANLAKFQHQNSFDRKTRL